MFRYNKGGNYQVFTQACFLPYINQFVYRTSYYLGGRLGVLLLPLLPLLPEELLLDDEDGV